MSACMLRSGYTITILADVTLMNYVCRVDDPLIWGVLPFKYAFNPGNHRWSLGSYDICFRNKCVKSILNFSCVFVLYLIANCNLLKSQIPLHLLHTRPSPPHPPVRILHPRRALPTNNIPSNPASVFPTILPTLKPSTQQPFGARQ
jgi:hypothetical protein